MYPTTPPTKPPTIGPTMGIHDKAAAPMPAPAAPHPRPKTIAQVVRPICSIACDSVISPEANFIKICDLVKRRNGKLPPLLFLVRQFVYAFRSELSPCAWQWLLEGVFIVSQHTGMAKIHHNKMVNIFILPKTNKCSIIMKRGQPLNSV